MPTYTSIEEYLAALPEDRRSGVETLRATVVAAAPEAVEAISYDMPALRLDGRFLVSWAAYRKHYSLFPASEAVVRELGDDIAPYLAGRGTIRFPADRPIPVDVVTRVVRTRVTEERAAQPRRAAREKG
jgi:uncharacterized protein YdhG (YjbR/CyaY superfamily)